MALSVKKGTFAFPDSSANLGVTGVGFQPKVIFFWLTKQSATGFSAGRFLSFGWAVSSTQRGVLSYTSSDAQTVGTTVGMTQTDARCIKSITCSAGSISTELDADFVSFDADGFTIDPVTVSAGKLYVVHYMALGGTDLTNAWAGNILAKSTTGTQGYTGVGFQPDCLLLLSATTGTIPRDDTAFKMSLGVADGTTQAVSFVEESTSIPTQLNSLQKTGEILHTLNLAGTDNTVASLSSFDADGFTLNFTTTAGARGILALALRGGHYKVATDTQKTSTGTKAKTGIGFTPSGLLLFGTNRASSASVDATLASLSIGASDGTTEGGTWGGSTDNVSTTDENSATVTDKIIRHATNSATTNAEADLSSFDADGYTLNWSTADATAREFIGLAVGSASATVTGSASLTVTAGIATTGTRVKTGASSSTFTVGIATSGGTSIRGSVSQTFTAGVTTAATRVRLAASSSTFAAGIATTGGAILHGAASQAYTVGIATVGKQTFGASASINATFVFGTRGVRGKSIVLEPMEPGVIP